MVFENGLSSPADTRITGLHTLVKSQPWFVWNIHCKLHYCRNITFVGEKPFLFSKLIRLTDSTYLSNRNKPPMRRSSSSFFLAVNPNFTLVLARRLLGFKSHYTHVFTFCPLLVAGSDIHSGQGCFPDPSRTDHHDEKRRK